MHAHGLGVLDIYIYHMVMVLTRLYSHMYTLYSTSRYMILTRRGLYAVSTGNSVSSNQSLHYNSLGGPRTGSRKYLDGLTICNVCRPSSHRYRQSNALYIPFRCGEELKRNCAKTPGVWVLSVELGQLQSSLPSCLK